MILFHFRGNPLATCSRKSPSSPGSELQPSLCSVRYTRLPAELAHSIARWFAAGASHHVYYMWQGGNHLARWAGASVTNMYADSAPVHSDGLPNEPKRSHLSNLHHTLSSLNHILLSHPPQVNRAYAIPVFDGDGYTTPRVFRSGLTICDEQNSLQLWSTNISSDLPYPLENATRLFISDGVSNLSFCLTFSGMQQAVTVLLCDASSPPVQSWLIKRSTQPGMQYIISSVASPGACIGLDLDSNDNFVSSSLLMQSCDFYDSGLAVSWSLDPAARTPQLTNSFAKSSCLSAIETANVTAFTYGSGSDSATFVVNRDIGSSARFLWSGAHYLLHLERRSFWTPMEWFCSTPSMFPIRPSSARTHQSLVATS